MHKSYWMVSCLLGWHLLQHSFPSIQRDVEGGTSISKNPPITRSIAVIFQLAKSTCLITASSSAFKGIPMMVPREMNNGKV